MINVLEDISREALESYNRQTISVRTAFGRPKFI